MTTASAATLATPVGPFTIVARGDVVLAAGFTADVQEHIDRIPADRRPREVEPANDLGAISRAVDAYFTGDLTAIDAIEVDQRGGVFLDRAFAELRAIPAGTTISYGELAKRADSPRAIRAAGQACARNLAALFVPCHRVLAANGTLNHYGYGLEVKRQLLAHEGAMLLR
jgi:methylated-DNA-[protein]-cysteine S-methyltransferase